MLSSQLVALFGDVSEVQLYGRSASLEVDSEVSEAHAILGLLPMLSVCDLRCELSALDFLLHLLCLPPSMLCPSDVDILSSQEP